jgi:ABC-type transport system involved in cytochrome c biogenesis permease subunit
VKSAASIIVLENGRKKPLDTFARNKLMQFSGKRRLDRKPALVWLTRLLFDPAKGDFDKIFLINNPEVATTLGIPPQTKRRYSYAALSGAAYRIQRYFSAAEKKKPEERSVFDKEIMRIYSNLFEYRTLASAFSFLEENRNFHVPPSDSVTGLPPLFTDQNRAPSFYDLLTQRPFLSEQMMRIQKTAPDSLDLSDRAIIAITKTMFHINESISNNPPHLIPVIKGEETWYSPWGFLDLNRSAALGNPSLQALIRIRNAYRAGSQQPFDAAVAALDKSVRSAAHGTGLPDTSLELFYNRLSAFFFAKILLGLAAIFAFIALFSTRKFVGITSLSGIIIAWLLCSVGLVLRMLIMHRPPVATLYETFIFVGWTTMIIGFILEYMRIRTIGILTASLAGFIFLHVAGRYAADGDTMGMLAAVLDSGFWLTTHIITIALGYAGCLGAGFIGHLFLLQRILFPGRQELLSGTSRAVYGVFAFGMLFTVIGTVTGGMWADQAWGRFWGWDPKENGALLIILWSMIVFHFRLTGKIKEIGFAIGSLGAAVLVMFTWIGVNLLGTGLHSYGFTSSGARLLLGYSGFEALFLAAFGAALRMKRECVSGKR